MKLTKTFFVVVALTTTLTFSCEGKSKPAETSDWLFKVDEKPITVSEFEGAYRGYLYVLAQRYQTTPEKLMETLEDPNTPFESRQALQEQVSKEAFLEQYKTFLVLQEEAKKRGALDKKEFAGVVNFANLFFVANYYLVERVMKEDAKVSDEDAAREWARMKKEDPRLMGEPIERGLEFARQQLETQYYMERQNKLLSSIKEAYKIETNEEVDMDKVLQDTNEKDSPEDEESKPTKE